MTQRSVKEMLHTAAKLHQAGRTLQAEQLFREILKADPGNADAYYFLGRIAYKTGKYELAGQLISKAIAKNPHNSFYFYYLGFSFLMQAKNDDAIHSFRRAVSIKADFLEAYNILGITLRRLGRYDEALQSFKRAADIQPDNVNMLYNLGLMFREQGKLDEALKSFRKTLKINPDFAKANTILGNILLEQDKLDEALFFFQHALKIEPDNAVAYNNIGNIFDRQSHLDKAVASFQKALSLNPDFAEAYYNLGNTLLKLGRLYEAITNYRRAIALKQDFTTGHSDLLLAMHYLPEVSQEDIFIESRNWDQQHARPFKAKQKPHHNSKDKNRRLKIGYVSPDFKDHPVNFFFEPVLKSHNRDRFEIYLYANVRNPDQTTKRLQAEADHWLSIFGITDEDIAERIREDRIDILVDLAKHTAYNRLLVFAHKPAPVQVTWMGYPGTTGMQAIDYRLVDELMCPRGKADELNSEELVRLPLGHFCFEPRSAAPEVIDTPAKKTGRITFGSFNNLLKINEEVIALWSEILNKMPSSHLLFVGKTFVQESAKKRFLDLFTGHGFGAERIEMIPRVPFHDYLALYGRVDIALDPFPYNGDTTTCDGLWMGVPLITLRGEQSASRAGASFLTRIELTELIAENKQEYVQKAISLAENIERLSALRLGMRQKILTSPICNVKAFTESIEEAYLMMWKRYISK